MRFLHTLILILILSYSISSFGQILDISPVFPTTSDDITIIYDATQGNGALTGTTTVYAHMGLITSESTSPTDWKHVQGNWGTPDSKVLMTNIGNNKHQIDINFPAFFDSWTPGEEVLQLSFVFRNADGSTVGRDTDGSDIFYDMFDPANGLVTIFLNPTSNAFVADISTSIPVVAAASLSSTLTLYDNGTQVYQTTGQDLNFNLPVNTSGNHLIQLVADTGSETDTASFQFAVNPVQTVLDPPAGTEPGIEILDNTSVRLSLYAPNKDFVYVLGSFNNFYPDVNYFMNKSTDGNTFWLDITGLNPGSTYAFQYFVDGDIKIADPYSEVILDPGNDGFVPDVTFPNLTYPDNASGLLTQFTLDPTPYDWQVTDFVKPDKEKLVIYELLVRDFVARHDYQTVIDSLDYLQNLGINAIELMPVNEFEGNSSWGYNPSYHNAIDKYYGQPDDFRAFVDACHERGIAVIIDVVFNHAFSQSPLCQLYWNANDFRPSSDNPWLNEFPKHAFNVGYDFDHESVATQQYMDRILKRWMIDYKIDGFRFDLSKGFTQVETCDGMGNDCDVAAWSAYDASRVALLKRMADEMWATSPDAYVILEHLSVNQEEKELSDYGMMLWGNMNYNYNQATMGFGNSGLSWGYYGSRGWNDPHLITYMESHDEERLMYKNLEFGNNSGSYNIKELNTALERCELGAVFFFPIPGPKMIWQFGELGYDINIDFNGRTGEKPILWEYFEESNFHRRQLYFVYKSLIHLRNTEPAFHTDDVSLSLGDMKTKKIFLNHSDMNVAIFGNFDVVNNNMTLNFQNDGMWFEYFSGDTLNVSGDVSATFRPGEYRLYTTKKVDNPVQEVISVRDINNLISNIHLFPNPVSDKLYLNYSLTENTNVEMSLFNHLGQLVYNQDMGYQFSGENLMEMEIPHLGSGIYYIQIKTKSGMAGKKFVKQ